MASKRKTPEQVMAEIRDRLGIGEDKIHAAIGDLQTGSFVTPHGGFQQRTSVTITALRHQVSRQIIHAQGSFRVVSTH